MDLIVKAFVQGFLSDKLVSCGIGNAKYIGNAPISSIDVFFFAGFGRYCLTLVHLLYR